jgi:hypothetical protein
MLGIKLSPQPFTGIPFWNAAAHKAAAQPVSDRLPVIIADVSGLPGSFPAWIATADLQGRTTLDGAEGSLVGCAAAKFLGKLTEYGLPPARECLSLLAGDFYAAPGVSERGGFGLVSSVLDAFRGASKSMAVVAGNHDDIPRETAGLLDNTVATFYGLKIAGISGIIGSSDRPWRRPQAEYFQMVKSLLDRRPNVLLLHEAPSVELMAIIEKSAFPGLIICGHRAWPNRLVRMGKATCLNVHSAMVILRSDQ